MERDSADWRKSTYSAANGGQCVEVGGVVSGVVVRDTANRAGSVLALPAGAWRALLAEVRAS
jgi:Domain of unknown function (DUF397)